MTQLSHLSREQDKTKILQKRATPELLEVYKKAQHQHELVPIKKRAKKARVCEDALTEVLRNPEEARASERELKMNRVQVNALRAVHAKNKDTTVYRFLMVSQKSR